MIIIEIFMLIFPRLICQLCIGKSFYEKFKVNYRGIKTLPYYLFDFFVFENAYRNAKKDNFQYKFLKTAHNFMLFNLILIVALPLIHLLFSEDVLVFAGIGLFVTTESAFIQAIYRRNINTKLH